MFGAILKLCRNVQKLDQYDILKEALQDEYIKAQIIDLNQSQLYDKGIEADGSPTGDYSKKSVEEYGKRPGHITLKDTGETYDTMEVRSFGGGFIIYATMDLHGVDLAVIYPHALGLTDDSIAEIIPLLRDKMIEIIYKKIMTDL